MTRRTMQSICRPFFALAFALGMTLPAAAAVQLQYLQALRGDHIDHQHGIMVADSQRWMEDIDSPQTRVWVQAQEKLSGAYLAALPHRQQIARRLMTIWNFERWPCSTRSRTASRI